MPLPEIAKQFVGATIAATAATSVVAKDANFDSPLDMTNNNSYASPLDMTNDRQYEASFEDTFRQSYPNATIQVAQYVEDVNGGQMPASHEHTAQILGQFCEELQAGLAPITHELSNTENPLHVDNLTNPDLATEYPPEDIQNPATFSTYGSLKEEFASAYMGAAADLNSANQIIEAVNGPQTAPECHFDNPTVEIVGQLIK